MTDRTAARSFRLRGGIGPPTKPRGWLLKRGIASLRVTTIPIAQQRRNNGRQAAAKMQFHNLAGVTRTQILQSSTARARTSQTVSAARTGAPSEPALGPPPAKGCEAELDLICPVATDPTPMKCGECAKSPLHYAQLLKAGCTEKIVRVLCEARGGSARL